MSWLDWLRNLVNAPNHTDTPARVTAPVRVGTPNRVAVPDEDALEARLRLPERWPGDRLAALLIACGSDRPGRAAAAAAELRGALERIPASRLIAVDRWVRGELTRGAYGIPGWVKTPAAIEHLRRRIGDSVAALCVLSMDPSGYVRQAAVERLARVGDGGLELPFLVLRSYDWVEPVRRAAQAAALERITPANLPRVLACVGLLVHTEQRERNGEVGRRAIALLRDPSARPLLRQGLRSPDGPTRLFCFGWLMQDEEERAQLVRDALATTDPVLRRGIQSFATRLPAAALPRLVPALLGDYQARMRSIGVINAHPAASYQPLLREAALDTNAGVRAAARFALEGSEPAVDAAWYRSRLAADPQSPGALAGLAELGTPADADVVERYLASPRARMRVVAVQGLARLLRSDAVPALSGMVADPSPRVSNAAVNALLRLRAAPAEVAPLFESAPPHVRRNALRLLVRRGRWDGLVYALRACADGDRRIAETGRGLLTRWVLRFNRGYAEPTPDQAARVKEALRSSAAMVPYDDWKRLMALLPQAMTPVVTDAGTRVGRGDP